MGRMKRAHLNPNKCNCISSDATCSNCLRKESAANSKTGSLRFNTGKPGSSELDPAFIMGIADVMTKAREKYDRANWAKGNDWSVPYDSMMRHLMAFQAGDDFDKETGKHHLLHAATNIMFLYYYYNNFPELDDRIFKKKK